MIQITKGSVNFSFEKLPGGNLQFSQVAFQIRISNLSKKTTPLPPHLYYFLTQTRRGSKMLVDSGVISGCRARLLDDAVPVRKKRAALWALGFIGASDKSVDWVVEQSLVSIIVKVAESSPYLSLRGTACYVLNMISGSKLGRKRIERNNWIIYDMSDRNNSAYLNGGLCLPKDMKQIFSISDLDTKTDEVFHQSQAADWDFYSKTLKMKLTDDPLKLRILSYITEMCFFINSPIHDEIAKICAAHKDLFSDPLFMHQFVTILTFARFRDSKARDTLFNILDQFILNQCFNLWGVNQTVHLVKAVPKTEEKKEEGESEGKRKETEIIEEVSLNGPEFDLF